MGCFSARSNTHSDCIAAWVLWAAQENRVTIYGLAASIDTTLPPLSLCTNCATLPPKELVFAEGRPKQLEEFQLV